MKDFVQSLMDKAPRPDEMRSYLTSKKWVEQAPGYWIHPDFTTHTRDLIGAYCVQCNADHEKQRLAEHLKTVAK